MTGPAIWLARGEQTAGTGRYSLMEHVAVRAGEPASRSPEAVHHLVAAVGNVVNDYLDDEKRQGLLGYERLLLQCPPRPDIEPDLSADMLAAALGLMLQVLPPVFHGGCLDAIGALSEKDGPSTESVAVFAWKVVCRSHDAAFTPSGVFALPVLSGGTVPGGDVARLPDTSDPAPVQYLAALIDGYQSVVQSRDLPEGGQGS